MHEQAVLPERCVVRSELLVGADQRIEQRVLVGQRLETDSLCGPLDADPGLADDGNSRRVDVEQSVWRGDLGRAVRNERIRIEAGEIGEPPVLVGLGGEGQRFVALEQLSPHARRIDGET